MKLTVNPNYNLYEKDGQAFCDSLQIAETFGKEHKHVLRDIEKTLDTFDKINQSKFGLINFKKTGYKDTKNRRQPMYLLTKDGFTYLTMGYEGEKAAQFKISYITRFNEMESFIRMQNSARGEFPAFTDAIMQFHKEPKRYHYTNEINMIYRIVLGMDAKTFRKLNGLKDGEVIRKYLTIGEIMAIEILQQVDIGLHEAGFSYEKRKAVLEGRFMRDRLKMLA